MTDLDRALDIDADLTLTVDEATVSIRGYGDLVVVAAPSLAVLRTLIDGGPPLPDRSHLVAGLRDADVTLDVRVRGRSVARAGPGYDPGPLSRALGVAPARISLGGLLLAALTEWRA
ncbi:hypothetical protein [Haloplanus aerogenes]|uniref:Peptide ABC transporter ATP-binding protein n=1 Tax=Haloplanus aerogenes TaxID=660522 RepID=A0A3M0DUC2_9EURY|nr:hypothetical protein [Haloplanus aerogenes]AZH25881.1 hypothetical protein DU502_11055 [Haloplanus aerogenes]RMB25634.1 hypothetical protein ATH50_0731 [Haloplanus aerogenes]